MQVTHSRMEEEKSLKVLDRLRALCSRREYCVSDIMKKALKALDGDKETAQTILMRLQEEKYVDNTRYASAFARDKSSIQGWGPVKIRYMLSAKGVSSDDISSALEEIDPQKHSDRLDKLLLVKKKSLNEDPQIRLKLLRFAIGRGYGYEEVMGALKRLD